MKAIFFRHALRFPGNAILTILSLLAIRVLLHRQLHFGFLVWNIFLAVLPLFAARAAVRTKSIRTGILLSAVWLLLFPNAAYLVTDIVHLRITPGSLFWLDLVLLFGAALLGMVLSIRSLYEIEIFWSRYLLPQWIPVLSAAALLASGYGIYLGRVERWNSWDALLQPLALLHDIFNDFRHPIRNREAWELTGLFATLQIGSYYLSRSVPGRRSPSH